MSAISTIDVYLNNRQIHKIPENTSLKDALEILGYKDKNFAVAINMIFVPRSLYSKTILQAHDHIEVVAPMQGG